jgi:uncharacterized protein YjbI with pentapeptide repeats
VLPKSDSGIDFSNVQFDRYVTFERHLFFDKADFENAVFDGQADFAGATFLGMANFENAAFSGMAGFDSVAFASPAIFRRVSFFENALFARATFFNLAYFVGATFSRGTPFGNALFTSAEFHYEANFFGTTFGGITNFNRTKFFRNVGFLNATFSRATKFEQATFFDDVNFESTTFFEEIAFTKTIFDGSSRFVNAKMKSKTSFKGATFKTKPPEFFGAELHEGSVWPGREAWPIPKATDEGEDFIHAYERLKLEMDGLKKHEDELDFFALELQSRRVWRGDWKKLESLKLLNRTISLPLRVLGKEISLYRPAEGLPIAIYGKLSDYGRSYIRPLKGLFYLALIGTLAFLPADSLSPGQSLGLSAVNTLNVFGFRKDFFDAATIESLPALSKILAALQTILGTILIFLFGLGIRNKFRMK